LEQHGNRTLLRGNEEPGALCQISRRWRADAFEQKDNRLLFRGLPVPLPDSIATTIIL
jgi:hypothetical protein